MCGQDRYSPEPEAAPLPEMNGFWVINLFPGSSRAVSVASGWEGSKDCCPREPAGAVEGEVPC